MPSFYAFAEGLAMGCAVRTVWLTDVFSGWAAPLIREPDPAVQSSWTLVMLAVAAGGCMGALLGRWSQGYADRLRAGAEAIARTLWAAATAAPSAAWRPVRDGTMAALLGLVVGALALDGGFRFVPLALVLAALAWIDARSGLLPDALTGPLMVAGWLLSPRDGLSAVGASLLVWTGLTGLAWLYRRVRGRDGLGGGDVKCLAALAGWVGLAATVAILWLACVAGLAGCLGRRGGWRQPYPFGPCIALAACVWMLAPLMMQALAVQS